MVSGYLKYDKYGFDVILVDRKFLFFFCSRQMKVTLFHEVGVVVRVAVFHGKDGGSSSVRVLESARIECLTPFFLTGEGMATRRDGGKVI